MSLPKVLSVNHDLPIRTDKPVHSGKVRSVYWLSAADSARLIQEKGYKVPADTPLAVMVSSDRISAFDCIWRGEGGLDGIPGKGLALNSIASHWFKTFAARGLAGNHILDVPHPYLWIVRQARPVKVEAIARGYITGSMWRDYSKGKRDICGITMPEGLKQNQKLAEVIVTPSTKGILKGIPGVPEADDVNVTRAQITANLSDFGLKSEADLELLEKLLKDGFGAISEELAKIDQVFVDTKFEFGYVKEADGSDKLIYIDEVGTPDSSRIWDGPAFRDGKIVENSKEDFRQILLNSLDSDILLNKERMPEREALAAKTLLPIETMMRVSATYVGIAEKILGRKLVIPQDPRAELDGVLRAYGIRA